MNDQTMNDQIIIWGLVALVYAAFCLLTALRDLRLWHDRQMREWHALIGTCSSVFGTNGYRPVYPEKRQSNFRLK